VKDFKLDFIIYIQFDLEFIRKIRGNEEFSFLDEIRMRNDENNLK
jgi:hypothetical protein